MQPGTLLDDFEDLSGWTAFASGVAELGIFPEAGTEGHAMRLDFDFHGGGGFVVARKEFPLDIPESYSFGFHIRGAAPSNVFEFKLVDKSNRNVWRYRAEEFAFPAEWQFLKIRSSQVEFAWGPLGGGPPRDVAAIELVIAAGPGGKGRVWVRGLHFQDDTYRSTPLVTASTALAGHDPQHVITVSEPSSWRSEISDAPQWLVIDFREAREFGGLVIHWEDHLCGRRFEVELSDDAKAWKTVYATTQGDSSRSYLYLPGTFSRYVRLRLYHSSGNQGFGIRGIEVKPHDFSRSLNHFFQGIAREYPTGFYPKYFLGRQSYWTPVGTGRGEGQALMNEEGMVEVDKGSFSIAPYLYTAGRLITWADAALKQDLMHGYLPIPSVEWQADLSLRSQAGQEPGGPPHMTPEQGAMPAAYPVDSNSGWRADPGRGMQADETVQRRVDERSGRQLWTEGRPTDGRPEPATFSSNSQGADPAGCGLVMTVTAFAAEESGKPFLYVCYRLENTTGEVVPVVFFAAFLPFQVTPIWQNWRSFGGVTPIRELRLGSGAVWINEGKEVIPVGRESVFGAAAFAEGGIAGYLARGQLPPRSAVEDEFGFASGALRFDFKLAPRSREEVVLAVPFGSLPKEPAGPVVASNSVAEARLREQKTGRTAPIAPVTETRHRPAAGDVSVNERGADRPFRVVPALASHSGSTLCGAAGPGPTVSARFEQAVKGWQSLLDKVEIRVPGREQALADTFRTAAGHILINRDGPALHPGPRRYSRSWIRDGAIMGAALLRVGCPEAMRDFLRWYRHYQAEDGNIPDCADREGTEWLPEYDAYGQFIYAVREYYRFTGDRAFVEEMWPALTRALAYMEGLRSKRLTPEYRTPEKEASYGLLPESMSHEGYMAHPVHSYWDDFWALRGFQDASAMAGMLGHAAEAARLAVLGETFAGDLRASLRATIARHGIEYVPGSVEFGDFDPAATSIALSLLDQLALLPRPEIDRTFDKYMAGFRERETGKVDWNNYSAYEIRIIGALVRLGRRQEALALTRFMLADRRIPAWNQWPEISWRDPSGPSFIGDLPHTWISAEYILAVRSLFVYEREADDSLVIAAGVDPEWLADGFSVGVVNMPTYYGNLSYRMIMQGPDTLSVSISGNLKVPKGGIVVKPPLVRSIRQVEFNGRTVAAFAPESFTCRDCPGEAMVRV